MVSMEAKQTVTYILKELSDLLEDLNELIK